MSQGGGRSEEALGALFPARSGKRRGACGDVRVSPSGTNEAFSRVKIDAQLRDHGWDVENPNAVRFECLLPDGTRADYVLCDRNRRSLAVGGDRACR